MNLQRWRTPALVGIADLLRMSRQVRKVPLAEVEYLGRTISSTDLRSEHLSLGRLTALVVGNRLSINITALMQHLLGRSPSPLRRAHRDRRPADRPDGDRYRTVRCHEHASGSAHAGHLDSPHADAAAPPAATFLAAQPARTQEHGAPRCPPAKAAD